MSSFFICVHHNWTFIDNTAVTSLHKDKLHPDAHILLFFGKDANKTTTDGIFQICKAH